MGEGLKRAAKATRATRKAPEKVSLADLLATLKGHPHRSVCSICKQDCERIALVDLVYRFEVCRCGQVAYSHLAEACYHANCLIIGTIKPKILGNIADVVLNYRPTEQGRIPCAYCGHPKWRHTNGRGGCNKTATGYGPDCYCARYKKGDTNG